ncbi:hypothetical protein ACV341_27665 [Pseudomonas aeruginosa]
MSAVSTSLLLFLNLLTPAQAALPVPLADGRIEIAAGESRQRYLDLAPGELQLLDLEVEQLQLAGGKVEVALAALAGSDLDAAIGQRHGLGGLGRGQQVEEKQQRGGNVRH